MRQGRAPVGDAARSFPRPALTPHHCPESLVIVLHRRQASRGFERPSPQLSPRCASLRGARGLGRVQRSFVRGEMEQPGPLTPASAARAVPVFSRKVDERRPESSGIGRMMSERAG
jgi:hypothetical protein